MNSRLNRLAVAFGIVSCAIAGALALPPGVVCAQNLTYNRDSLEFGPVVVGQSGFDSVRVRTSGEGSVTVSSLSTSTAEFTVLTAVPFTLPGFGATRWISVRFQSAVVGEVRDTLVIVSNDSDEPVHKVPLKATSLPPPSIEVSPEALEPVELPFGETTVRSVQVGNIGPAVPLHVTASIVVDSFQVEQPDTSLGTTPMPALRSDSEGHAWDVQGDGSIGTGDPGGFDADVGGGLRWMDFPNLPTAELHDGGRAFRLSTVQDGLVLERRIHVSLSEPWIRYIDSVTNPGPDPVTVAIPIQSRLDLALLTTHTTSNGNGTFEPGDDWLVVEDQDGPVIAHVIAGPGGLRPGFTGLFNGVRDVRYTFGFTLDPGQTGSILHYALQAPTRADAIQRAEALRTPSAAALEGMDMMMTARIRNFMLSPFSLPVTSLVVAAGDEQELPIGFDSGLGPGGLTCFGRIRMDSDDPLRPVVFVPFELRVTGESGPPVPVEPVPRKALALAARFVSNPARAGRLQLSYVLPAAGTARFELYDVRGRRVAARTLEDAPAGPGAMQWETVEDGFVPASCG